PLKSPVYYDLQTSLGNWLDSDQEVSFQSSGNGDDPPMVLPKPPFTSQQCRTELLRLHSLRKCLSNSILKPHSHKAALEENALEDSMEYHAALLEFEQRGFPTLDDENNELELVWKAAFSPQKEGHHTLVWDRACCLWNIAALYSQKILTLAENYAEERDAQKQIIQYSQTAASLLNILGQLVSSDENMDLATVEMSKPMITFWEKWFLAQAQSTIPKIADQSKHSILAALHASTHQLFNEALACAQDPRLQSEVPRFAKEWGAYCKAQSMLSSAKAEYHMALAHRTTQQWGHELARLKTCWQKLQEAHKFLEAASEEQSLIGIRRQVDTYLPFVENRYQQAHTDNTTVYQDEVPASLPDVEPKQLAKLNGGTLPEPMTNPKVKLFVNL
ncbi:Rhophilin, Rho GTPase binding protein (Partial), partial [Seminavis robusta]